MKPLRNGYSTLRFMLSILTSQRAHIPNIVNSSNLSNVQKKPTLSQIRHRKPWRNNIVNSKRTVCNYNVWLNVICCKTRKDVRVYVDSGALNQSSDRCSQIWRYSVSYNVIWGVPLTYNQTLCLSMCRLINRFLCLTCTCASSIS